MFGIYAKINKSILNKLLAENLFSLMLVRKLKETCMQYKQNRCTKFHPNPSPEGARKQYNAR